MLNTNHPDDEVLSAHAAGDPDAAADSSLDAHLASCERCAGVVRDLGVLRAVLGELPDIEPHRPLRLIPVVDAEPSRADALGQWVRRLFAPALTAGAALAMVGLVGTALPSLEGMGASGGAQAAPSEATRALTAEDASDGPEGDAANGAAATDTIEFSAPTDAGGGGAVTGGDEATAEQPATEEAGTALADPAEPERSPWPMVLFSGVALMIAAALLRWILAAPAG